MNVLLIYLFTLIFTFFASHTIKESLFPLEVTGLRNYLIFVLVVLALSLVGAGFFIRREYKGVKKNKMKLIPFLKQMVLKNTPFLEKHASEKRPPYLVLSLFLAGASSIMGGLTGASFLYSGIAESWITMWILLLIFAVMYGYLRYVVVGALYQILVWFSGGGSKGFLVSRNIALYTMLPFFLASFLAKMVEMIVYRDSYFIAPTYKWLTITLVVITVLAGIHSVFLLYKATVKLKKTKKKRSIFFFIIIPIIIVLLARAHSISEAFDPLSKSLDYNNQTLMYIDKGDYDAAEVSAIRAIESVEPENKDEIVTMHINLATIYLNKGDTDSAKKTYKNALEYLSKEDAQFFGVSGILEILNDNLEGAITSFEMALKIDPQNYTANNYLGLIYLGNMGAEFADPAKALEYNLAIYQKNVK